MTDLSGHDGKVTSGKKIIVIPYEAYECGNRDHCRHSSVTFETKAKFLIVFVRLILEKVGVDGFTGPKRKRLILPKVRIDLFIGPRRESDIR